MHLVGILPIRNEDWICGLTVRALLMFCDEVVALDHASTDNTPEILREVSRESPDRLTVLRDDNPEWLEMGHRQQLLDAAREHRATHVAIIDADEMLTGNLLPYIRGWLEATPPGAVLALPWICLQRSPLRYRTDTFIRTTPMASTAFTDRADLCWKTAQGYQHHHREPYNAVYPAMPQAMQDMTKESGGRFEAGGLVHFQFTDWPRIVAKHALYKMNEVARWPGRKTPEEIERQYNPTLDEAGIETKPVPLSWWEPYRHLMHHLVLGKRPWQADEAKNLWQNHGGDKFQGLTLFGIVP